MIEIVKWNARLRGKLPKIGTKVLSIAEQLLFLIQDSFDLAPQQAFTETVLGKPHKNLQKLLDRAPETRPVRKEKEVLKECEACGEKFFSNSYALKHHGKSCYYQRKHLWAPLKRDTVESYGFMATAALNGEESDIYVLANRLDKAGQQVVIYDVIKTNKIN